VTKVSVLQAFFAGNVRASRRIAAALRIPSDKPFWRRFEAEARRTLATLPLGSSAVDLGGGRRCVYADALPDRAAVRLVAVDVSAEELALNADVDETVLADAGHLPFPDGSIDLILSRAVLEHVPDVPQAAREMARVTRPCGVSLHFLPGRYALFAIAARALPFGALLRLLHAVSPATRGEVEFDVHYDHRHPAAIERAFREAGFRDVRVETCWAAPGYFEPVVPLFLMVSAYETLGRMLGIRRLASYMIVRAER
jgi:ubiquinone/menaquinone biosynthesis C-methylase UbiE